MTTAAESLPATAAWWGRLRFFLAAALVWAGLHYVVAQLALPSGLDRPVVLVGSSYGVVAGVLLVILLWLAGVVTGLVTGDVSGRKPLMAIGLGLALWAYEGGAQGGTIDAWLVLVNTVPGPPTAAPYRMLLGDYLFLLVGLAGAFAGARWLGGGGKRDFKTLLGLTNEGGQAQMGPSSLAITTIVAGVAIFVLTGPPTGATYRGQVCFAVAVGLLFGVYAAKRLVGEPGLIWFWPAPLLVGVIGLIIAMVKPGLMLPVAYGQINSIPACGLVRALPVELVGVGLVASLWLLPESVSQKGPDETR